MTREKLIDLFGIEWYEALRDTLHSVEFSNLACDITEARKRETVYPPREDIFRAFKSTPFNHLFKGMILGQDVYHDGSATGLSFGIKLTQTRIPPSLARIKREVMDDIYHGDQDTPFDYTMQKWANQGILMLNTALTVVEGKPGSHITLWENFVKKVLEVLNTRDDVVYLCLGKISTALITKHITNKSAAIINVGHPSPLNTTIPFLGTKPFSRFNEELLARNKKEIIW